VVVRGGTDKQQEGSSGLGREIGRSSRRGH